ncbi:helix-turn-helix transcriptional regulator [Bifidobacterium sp. ESL0682]|uniref:helix-turn-helix domain-containing protein n=1 Tax=Bifidobacterium sp. ESL0682 TaxID=2983212 RepID=UPI0023F9C108|nr:helix-turn-helix transcriptional regulator [Bifidobacterium sp. ESL0682]WEV41612.1 helix-turn-helix transcriptional regulator [Bifidobacterium sp. ESL0682]
MKDSQKYLSQTINGLLASSGKTRDDLAKYLGIQRRVLYQRLSNKQSWTVEELDKIALFFGYDDAYALSALASAQKQVDRKLSTTQAA